MVYSYKEILYGNEEWTIIESNNLGESYEHFLGE